MAREELGTLDRVSQVMQVNVLVQCSPGYENLSRVADGASEAFGVPNRLGLDSGPT